MKVVKEVFIINWIYNSEPPVWIRVDGCWGDGERGRNVATGSHAVCVWREHITQTKVMLHVVSFWNDPSLIMIKCLTDLSFSLNLSPPRVISPDRVWQLVHKSLGCSGQPGRHVTYLEHVILRITITHPHRGDLSITLTSPSGTKSQLLAIR